MKEILTGLQADGLVDFDKIGSGNFYWSLPSKEFVQKRARLEKSQISLAAAKEKLEAAESRKKSALKLRVQNAAREAKMKKLNESKAEIKEIDNQLNQFAEFDPDRLRSLNEASKVSLDSANRWTENLFNLINYVKSRNESVETSAILKQIGLPADLEEIQ